MRLLVLGLIATLQAVVLWQVVTLNHRAVQIEASLEFMDYEKRPAAVCARPLCDASCGDEVIGMLDLP